MTGDWGMGGRLEETNPASGFRILDLVTLPPSSPRCKNVKIWENSEKVKKKKNEKVKIW